MTDEELVARLRAWGGTPFDDDAEAAADRIYNLGLLHDMAEARAEAAEAEVSALQAEIVTLKEREEKLRGALEQIADQQADHAAVDRCTCTPKEMLNEARAIARAALTTEELK